MILLYILIVIVLFTIAVLLYMKLPVFGAKVEGDLLTRLEQSPQFINGRFRNRNRKRADMSLSKMPKLIQESNNSKVDKKPRRAIPFLERKKEDFTATYNGKLRITWFGHSAFLLEVDGLKILIDPMLGKAAAPVSFAVRRFHKKVPIQVEDLPEIDAVIFTHDHYDHLDYGTVKKLRNKVKHFYTPLGVGAHLEKWGVDKKKVSELDWWGETTLGHIGLTATPTQHFSGRTFGDRDKTLWCSWVIQTKELNLFFSSDSGYFGGFEQIGNEYGPFDLCFMECGQYHYMWKENHMTPEESAQAFLDLKGEKMIAMHWGAFSLAPHDWRDPIERMVHASKELDIDLITPKIGESVELEIHEPKAYWWRDL